MKKIGILLAGCGVYDGSEIHESVSALLAVDRAEAQVVYMAPDIPQHHLMNHQLGQEVPAQLRRVREEAARIARGPVRNLAIVKEEDLDALIVPGGMGVAKNLSDFAFKGADCRVIPEVEKLILAMYEAKKPMGFICIAPALAARVLGSKGIQVTIGHDAAIAAILEKMGAKHVDCPADAICVDKIHRIVSTPAYMLAKGPTEVFNGVSKLVEAILELTQ